MNNDPKKLRDYTECQVCDQMMAQPLLTEDEIQSAPATLPCPVHMYYSDIDQVWPLSVSVEGEDIGHSSYDDITTTWQRFAPEGQLTCTLFENVTHASLGAAESPVF